jgi:hypothetical protein
VRVSWYLVHIQQLKLLGTKVNHKFCSSRSSFFWKKFLWKNMFYNITWHICSSHYINLLQLYFYFYNVLNIIWCCCLFCFLGSRILAGRLSLYVKKDGELFASFLQLEQFRMWLCDRILLGQLQYRLIPFARCILTVVVWMLFFSFSQVKWNQL